MAEINQAEVMDALHECYDPEQKTPNGNWVWSSIPKTGTPFLPSDLAAAYKNVMLAQQLYLKMLQKHACRYRRCSRYR